MRIAVISDIHSNLLALRAVLQDIEQRQVDVIICGGDLVGYAPFPNEVIDLIKEKEIPCVMGNYDDAIGNARLICGCDFKDAKTQELGERSIAWTSQNMSEENKEFLRNLPSEIHFKAGEYSVKFVHGSPRRLNEYLSEDVSDEYLKELLDESNTDVLICGHTHTPYHKTLDPDKHVINAGSVGLPKHGDPLSVYALVEIDRKLQATFPKVSYDFERVAGVIEASSLPKEFAANLRTGRG